MVVLYLLGTLVIIGMNIYTIPVVFVSIFKGAFAMKSVGGGIVGSGIALAMKMGMKRGVFSNEAGLGSSDYGTFQLQCKGAGASGYVGHLRGVCGYHHRLHADSAHHLKLRSRGSDDGAADR